MKHISCHKHNEHIDYTDYITTVIACRLVLG